MARPAKVKREARTARVEKLNAPATDEKLWGAMLLVFGVTLAVFARTVVNGLVHWDDGDNITGNPFINPPTWRSIWYLWTNPYQDLYVPLVYTSFAGEMLLGGRPALIHFTNALLHSLSAVVVFQILWQLLPRSKHSRIAAGIGALLFSLHPLQTEAVAWATGRKDTLSGLMALVTVWQYVLFRQDEKQRVVHYVISVTAFALALLAKPAAVATPLALLAVDYFALRRPLRDSVKALALPVALAALFTFITTQVQVPSQEFLKALPASWTRPFIAADAVVWYAKKVILPFGFAPVYGRTPSLVAAGVWMYVAFVLCVAAFLYLVRRRDLWAAGAALFVVFIVPVSGIVPFVYQRYSTVADRYAYLSMLGAGLLVAYKIYLIAERRRLDLKSLAVAAGVVLVALSAVTFRQIGYWKDSEALWKRSLRIEPGASVPHTNLATLYLNQNRQDLSVQHYEEALKLDPQGSTAHLGYGKIKLQRGDLDGALAHFEQAIASDHNLSEAYVGAGEVMLRKGQKAEAFSLYEKAVEKRGTNFKALLKLGSMYADAGDFDKAEEKVTAVLKLNPKLSMAYGLLGMVRAGQGRRQEAAEAYRRALELNPNDAQARANLAALQSGA